MTANFESATFTDMPAQDLRREFRNHQARLRAERGSGSRQGHLGLKNGLHAYEDRAPFPDLVAALGFCEGNEGDKGPWGPATAVRFREEDGTVRWLVAGQCPA